MSGTMVTGRETVLAARLRAACDDVEARRRLCEATGWDDSMPNKVKNNQNGITVEKLDSVFRALGLCVMTNEYADYLARGNQIGSACECARLNMGECGRSI